MTHVAIALRDMHIAQPDRLIEFDRIAVPGCTKRRHIYRKQFYDLSCAAERARFERDFAAISDDLRYDDLRPLPMFVQLPDPDGATLQPPTDVEGALHTLHFLTRCVPGLAEQFIGITTAALTEYQKSLADADALAAKLKAEAEAQAAADLAATQVPTSEDLKQLKIPDEPKPPVESLPNLPFGHLRHQDKATPPVPVEETPPAPVADTPAPAPTEEVQGVAGELPDELDEPTPPVETPKPTPKPAAKKAAKKPTAKKAAKPATTTC